MPEIALAFTLDEYRQRLARVRAALDAAEADILVVSDPSNIAWLTGYDGWSFYVHQAVIVGPDDELVWWGRGMDAVGARKTVHMPAEDIVGYPDAWVMDPDRHTMLHLAQTIRERGWGDLRIGVERENYYYSAAAHAALVTGLPDAHFLDASSLVNWCRGVKSEAEIDLIRKAARIAEAIQARMAECAEPGVRKNDLAAEIFAVALRGIEDENGNRVGGDYAAIVPLICAGRDAAAAHLTWNDAPLEHGTGTFFEIAGCVRRYHAPLSRTIFLGTPPDVMRRAEAALLEGIDRAIDAARAGSRACDVAGALTAALAKAGIRKEGRCGYGVGLSYPPDWGERTISFRDNDRSVLEAGMTFHLMPALWMEDWGIEMSETILIRPDGPAECLTSYPRPMLVKP